GLNDTDTEEIRLAAMLHDIGKVGIPGAVLNKSGPLNLEEWDLMKQHVHFGARILEPFPCIERIRQMVEHHHEYFDGSGYPEAQAGEDILLGARIIGLADAYDTITSDRTYKRGRTSEEAFAELERCCGAQFDPRLVARFIELLRKMPHPIVEAVTAQTQGVAPRA
ncbi:MAG: HD-GYP domain-containing protein, partial [Bryobacteraceae bacterium]